MSVELPSADTSAEDAPVVDTLAADAPEVTTEGAEDEPGEDTTAAPDAEAPKPKPTAKDRIDELTAKRREAEREAEYWKAKALQAPTTATPAPQAAPEGDKEPDPADYEHGDLDVNFIRDHTAFVTTKTFEAKIKERETAQAQKSAQTAWQAKEDAVATKYPDYGDKVTRGAWDCTQDMATAIRESDVGPDLAYHLATNPGEARRIAALSPHSQAREIGRLEGQFITAPKPQAKVVSDAPDPSPALKGQVGVSTNRPDDRQSMADWIAARNRQVGR